MARRVSLVLIAAVVTFAGVLVVPPLSGQLKTPKQDPAGDTATVVLPIATDLSPKLKRKEVARAIQKVGDWQLERARAHFNQDWTYAALYAGFMAVPEGAV
jgi:uncharacterized membrane protein